jgi:hypothetical protein
MSRGACTFFVNLSADVLSFTDKPIRNDAIGRAKQTKSY